MKTNSREDDAAMTMIEELDRIAINVKSHRLLKAFLKENPKLEEIMHN